MKKFFAVVSLVCICLFNNRADAQDAIVQEGEFGIGLGAAHYFGDLNTRAHLNRPKMAATITHNSLLVENGASPVLRPVCPFTKYRNG